MSQDPAMHIMPEDEAVQHRRESLLETLAVIAPAEVETKFRAFFGAGSGAWCEWEDRFVAFIARHRDGRLLAGKVGEDLYAVFSPEGRAGFWVYAHRGGGSGKGFLSETDLDKLTDLARQKGLV